MVKPFIQFTLNSFKLRIFILFLKSFFVRHKDLNDRIIVGIFGDCYLQKENELPKLIKINKIRKNQYHRIIPKSILMILLIKEIRNE